ncbi:MAG: hypothetical protein M3491_13435, partial [Actinomycetota bacterium]|nr:hypothetical protein [Actinomycetota bacterium]
MNTRRLSVLFLATTIVAILSAGGSAFGMGADDLVAVGTCTGETIELNGSEKRMLDLHNQTRADHGLQPLCADPA